MGVATTAAPRIARSLVSLQNTEAHSRLGWQCTELRPHLNRLSIAPSIILQTSSFFSLPLLSFYQRRHPQLVESFWRYDTLRRVHAASCQPRSLCSLVPDYGKVNDRWQGKHQPQRAFCRRFQARDETDPVVLLHFSRATGIEIWIWSVMTSPFHVRFYGCCD